MSQIDDLLNYFKIFITTFYWCARLGTGDTGRGVLKVILDQGDKQMYEIIQSSSPGKWQMRCLKIFPLENI